MLILTQENLNNQIKMIYGITCPVCEFKFDAEEDEPYGEDMFMVKEGGNCQNCNTHFTFDTDFDCIGAVMEADFDYRYMNDEQKEIERKRAKEYIRNKQK